MGIDVPKPRFSWKLESDQRGVYQSGYQLMVGSSAEDLKKGKDLLWDTGKLDGQTTVNLEYAGSPMESNQKYFWKVIVWLEDGSTVHSQPATFHTGILDQAVWRAGWITADDSITDQSPRL
jgi:alpha-L-rhamnosidase